MLKSFLRYIQLLLQIKQMMFKDMRLNLISEILSSIKVSTFYAAGNYTSKEHTHFSREQLTYGQELNKCILIYVSY